jgi:glycosyltransferase involved in cell wall biosynthesis
MIAKNEARNLQACLDSVRGVVDEIVLVDTGSSDATREIAARNGAKVLPFDFSFVDFAAARNHALEHASGEWIFVLDADEILDVSGAPTIRELIARDENCGYYVARHNPAVDYAVRIFPNRKDYRYRGRVHETIDAAILAGGGKLSRTDIRIDHHFAADPEARRRKNHWYIGILQEEIAANPGDDSRLDFLAAEYHQLEMFDEAAAVAERIVKARPLDATAHLNAGIYHLVYQANARRARLDFLRALELKPGYPEAKAFLDGIEKNGSNEPPPGSVIT